MVGWALVYVALAASSLMWSGFVVMALWNWFAVAQGASAITYPLAIGMTLLVQCMRPQFTPPHPHGDSLRFIKFALLHLYVVPLLTLATGYLVNVWGAA